MYGGRDYNPPPAFFSPSPSPFNHQIHHSTYVPSKHPTENAAARVFKAQMAWLSSSEAKQRSDAAKAHALSEFTKRFPRADISKFIARVDFDSNYKATGRVLFPVGDSLWENPLIEDGKYWSQAMKDALGFYQDGGFPIQLSTLIQTKPQMPIPAVDFSEEIDKPMHIGDILNKRLKIYVTPTEKYSKIRRSNSQPQNMQESGSKDRT